MFSANDDMTEVNDFVVSEPDPRTLLHVRGSGSETNDFDAWMSSGSFLHEKESGY